MIIGISGKINSGKDTVGSIIQYLTDINTDNDSTTYEQYLETLTMVPSKWKIKKFADKLKDIVCLLIGCTRKQLEDREFKEKELGEEWWYYKLPNNSLIAYLDDNQPEFIKKYTLIKLTPRKLLQLLGTEAGRNIIHPNIWVNTLFADYKGTMLKAHSGSMLDENCYIHLKCDVCKNKFYGYKRQFRCKECTDKLNPVYPNWIITDLRFSNELEAVKERGGITIRVNRNTVIKDDNGNPIKSDKSYSNISTVEHPSETALDDGTFDYVINNSGTLKDLINKVKEILINEKII